MIRSSNYQIAFSKNRFPRTGIQFKDLFDGNSILVLTHDGTYPAWDGLQAAVPSNDVRLVNLPARLGNGALRFECNANAPYNGSFRSELVTHYRNEWEHWWGFSQYFPSPYIPDPASEIIWQCHDNSGIQGRSPSLCLKNVNNQISLINEWDEINNVASNQIMPVGPIVTDQWIDWVIYAKFTYGTNGIVRCWRNRQLVAERFGQTHFNDTIPSYHKIGIYKSSWEHGYFNFNIPRETVTSQRIMYVDEYRRGNATSSFRDVDPEFRDPL